MAACGIAPEDDDGNLASKKDRVVKGDYSLLQDHLIAIQDAKNVEELQIAFKEAFKAAGTNKEWLEAITGAKDLMKRKLK